MKKNIIITVIIISIFTLIACNNTAKNIQKPDTGKISPNVANAQKTLNWEGLYFVVSPCADCPGIETQLELFKDNTYKLSRLYIDKNAVAFLNQGSFSWNKQGTQISLDNLNENGAYQYYIVQENQLILLDIEGNIPETNDMTNYILKKITSNDSLQIDAKLVNKYWKLVELNGKAIDYSENQSEAQLVFRLDGRVNGNLSCNSFSAHYTVSEGGRIKILQPISTQKMCLNMSIEDEVKKVLNMVDNYNVSDDELILNRARMAPLARFKAIWMN